MLKYEIFKKNSINEHNRFYIQIVNLKNLHILYKDLINYFLNNNNLKIIQPNYYYQITHYFK